jgi:large subunit ribosomal protein L30
MVKKKPKTGEPVDPRAQQAPTSDLTLVVTQVRSGIGCQQNQRLTLRALGLRKISQSVERRDTPQVRGMIQTVRHLVTVEEVGAS